MNHQPYENWILDQEKLTIDQKHELGTHLSRCADCDQLTRAHGQVETLLTRAQVLPAPAGFTSRWKASLVYRRREQETKQARTMLISFASMAGAILLAAGFLFLPDFSLISLTAGSVSTLVNLLNGLENFWSTVARLVQVVPPSALIIISMFISSWIILASAIWGISIWKLAIKRGMTK